MFIVLEKFNWKTTDIAHHLKVCIYFSFQSVCSFLNQLCSQVLLIKVRLVKKSPFVVFKFLVTMDLFQIELDSMFGCIWHVVVGEEFTSSITYEVGQYL